jgi:replication factor C small subunit
MLGEMSKIDNKHYLWVEKYRPQTVKDVILPENIKNKIIKWITEDKEIPHIGLWSNTPGLGKSSIAKCIINDLDADSLFINSSKENGIDIVRNKLQTFASSVSFEGGVKIAILDEFDGTTNDMQKSFRSAIEEYTVNCRYILTGNQKNKVMEPILNRLTNFDLDNIFSKSKSELAKQSYNRLCYILTNEKIQFKPQDVQTLVSNFYPSLREMINVSQQSIEDGVLVVDYTTSELNKVYIEILNTIKIKDYSKCRRLASEIASPNGFYKYIYKNIDTLFEVNSIPQAVVNVQYFMSTNTNARDPEISIASLCAKLMMSNDIKFK